MLACKLELPLPLLLRVRLRKLSAIGHVEGHPLEDCWRERRHWRWGEVQRSRIGHARVGWSTAPTAASAGWLAHSHRRLNPMDRVDNWTLVAVQSRLLRPTSKVTPRSVAEEYCAVHSAAPRDKRARTRDAATG